jgi:hypothetical protein
MACGGRSSVTLMLLLVEDPTSVFLRHVGHGTEAEYSSV